MEPLAALRAQQQKLNTLYKPLFYRIDQPEDKKNFTALLSLPGMVVVDYIFDQVKELVKIKNPSVRFSATELEAATQKHIGTRMDDYGVWIYYPWSNRLVHILDEEEFIAVRTSRNQYKITPAERDLLAGKKIGVIGLSVGQSVSVTLAMERICGELRLADFDILELTNLNRIRTGVYNLGLPKVYSVAREIAEIDPYLKVVCFPKGLTEENMDEFFTGGGRLDLLVEESDGFDIKILSRYKARELKIPVIMEASDRCMVDVERFDLEPDRSILHGLVDHLDIDTLKSLKTNEQKIPYMLDVIGIDTSSLRLKASMLEIEQTITTWPQLASAVTMGGGITADVSRRMLLNQYTESGRYHVDVEQLIGNKQPQPSPGKETNSGGVTPALPNLHELGESVKIIDHGQTHLEKTDTEALVKAGCQAPSGGNAQPWRWIYRHNTLFLFNGFDSGNSFLGYGNLASYVGMGAAAENISLRAAEMGLETKVSLFPDQQLPELVAAFDFYRSPAPPSKNEGRAGMIDLRLTNRKLGVRPVIEQNILNKLADAATDTQGAGLSFFTDAEQLDAIADVLGELEKIRLLEKTGHRDFVDEIRWTKEENDAKRDGVDLRTLDLTNSELVGLRISKDESLMSLISEWNGGGAFKKLTKKSIDAAGAIGVITMPGHKNEDYFNGGRVMQRIWLEANLNGISFQPMAASVFLYARFLDGNGEGLSREGFNKLKELRPVFEKILSITKDRREIFIFRLSKAADPEIKSLRKPLNELFSYMT